MKTNCFDCAMFADALHTYYNSLTDVTKDTPIEYLDKMKQHFDNLCWRQLHFVACKLALRKYHPTIAPLLDNPPIYAENLTLEQLQDIINNIKEKLGAEK